MLSMHPTPYVSGGEMPDLNLLITLDALLAEGSVAGAARRLRLSPSAMSRALARLRQVTGDPLLVRAGRGLVPTPRAVELRGAVGTLVDGANAVLRPAAELDLARLTRRFTLRTSEGFPETFGPRLLALVGAEAPGVTLQFLAKADKESAPLREGEVDIETGVIDAATAPEMRALPLFADRWVGVVREGHPLTRGRVTAARYAAADHVHVLRRGLHSAEIDAALAGEGLERRVTVIVSGFATALALARETPLVAAVPERHTAGLRKGMRSFPLPLAIAPFTVSVLWHPRMDGDLAHRWLRARLREACGGRKARG
jgi:DNA-binding transcriptional LysR family regulator